MENSENSKKKKKIQKRTCGTTWNSKDKNTLQNPLSFNKLWFCFSFNLLYGTEAYIPSSVELFISAPEKIKFYLLELKL